MARRTTILAGALALALGTIAPGAAQEFAPFATIETAPTDAEVEAGEHIDGTELTDSRPIIDGPTGPLPVFAADDGFGCVWATAAASEADGWIGVARRGTADVEGTDQCPGFQSKLTLASAAGAHGLLVVNFEPGHVAGTAAGVIPGMMIDRDDGNRLLASLNPDQPESVLVNLQALDPATHLPLSVMRPTTLSSLQTDLSDGMLGISGQASFGGQGDETVGTDPAGDTPFGAVPELGFDLIEALIAQPDPFSGDLRFTLRLTGLPPSGALPEVARYIWDFGVLVPGDPEPVLLSIDGRLTNVIREQSTAVPSFQLRGNCETDDNNITTCENLGPVETRLNPTRAEIVMTVPRSMVEEEVGGSLAGARIVPADICEGISVKVAAYFSLCGGDVGQATGDTIIQDPETDVYDVADRRLVEVGITPAGEPASYTTEASVGFGTAFSATLDVSDLEPGDYEVHVRACYGTNCDVTSEEVTL